MKDQKPHPQAAEIEDDINQQCRLLHWTRILNGKSYYRRFSAPMINRAKKAMIDEGFIKDVEKTEVMEDENGRERSKKKKTPFVRLVRKAN